MKFQPILRFSIVALAGFAALTAGGIGAASARSGRYAEPYGRFDPAAAPVLAIVGLKEQRISIYDGAGKIMEAPVSSGATGLETPAGIYSVVQKEEEHYSNRYDDASMPYMERITWTGIALHGGVLPGYPASHGCVRMPEEFAERLYRVTQLGMRVIVVREDIAPAEIAQPALFTPSKSSAHETRLGELQRIAAAKKPEAEAAVKREKELRLAAAKAAAAIAPAVRLQREAEAGLAKAEAELKESQRAPAAALPAAQNADLETAKAKALAKTEAAKVKLEAAKLQAQSKMDAAARAQEEVQAAAAAKNIALDAAEAAQQNLSPVSVFISRKMQRLYIRKGNQPVFEGPVTIRDADKPIGTFVYTALDYTGTPGEMRWNAVSMYRNPAHAEPSVQEKGSRAKARPAGPAPADIDGAQAALGRLVVPQDTAARISGVVLPGSSLIVSDEGPSIETGKDTDFVVVMSGEPQGGLAIRRREKPRSQDEFAFWRSARERRSYGGGFPFFFSDY